MTCSIFGGQSVRRRRQRQRRTRRRHQPAGHEPSPVSVSTTQDMTASTVRQLHRRAAGQTVATDRTTCRPRPPADDRGRRTDRVQDRRSRHPRPAAMSGSRRQPDHDHVPVRDRVGQLINSDRDRQHRREPAVGYCSSSATGTTATCSILRRPNLAAGHSISIELDGVTNPAPRQPSTSPGHHHLRPNRQHRPTTTPSRRPGSRRNRPSRSPRHSGAAGDADDLHDRVHDVRPPVRCPAAANSRSRSRSPPAPV